MAQEINSLINEVRPVADDGCDHTGSIIDRWHCAARARSRTYATPPVKPVPVCKSQRRGGQNWQPSGVREERFNGDLPSAPVR